jgi:hypothetical protein
MDGTRTQGPKRRRLGSAAGRAESGRAHVARQEGLFIWHDVGVLDT